MEETSKKNNNFVMMQGIIANLLQLMDKETDIEMLNKYSSIVNRMTDAISKMAKYHDKVEEIINKTNEDDSEFMDLNSVEIEIVEDYIANVKRIKKEKERLAQEAEEAEEAAEEEFSFPNYRVRSK